MEDLKEMATIGVCVVAAVVVLFLAVLVIGNGINYIFIDTVPIKVTVGGKEVYSGISACVNVKSSGDTTTVCIRRSLFCILPGAYYVGKNIEIKGVK